MKQTRFSNFFILSGHWKITVPRYITTLLITKYLTDIISGYNRYFMLLKTSDNYYYTAALKKYTLAKLRYTAVRPLFIFSRSLYFVRYTCIIICSIHCTYISKYFYTNTTALLHYALSGYIRPECILYCIHSIMWNPLIPT